jgi:hypothetical protein
MPLPQYILVHTAVPLTYEEPQTDPATWIEGEPGSAGGGEPTNGTPFVCVLFMPSPGGEQQNEYRPKVIRQPTILYNPTRDQPKAAFAGAPAVPANNTPIVITNEDELMITAPELAAWTGGDTVRWQAAGDAQPFGPPGVVFGIMATLRIVKD